MNSNGLVVNLVKRGDTFYVSSKEVAEKFGKQHRHVMKAIDDLQLPENFRLLNFEQCYEPDSNDIDRRVIYMTRDGFSILAFGFIGRAALEWKLLFLAAFNKMESFILEKVPLIEKENRELREKIKRLEGERQYLLEEPKKQHGNKGTVLVPVTVTTLFGQEVEYHRVPKNSDHYSDLSYKEGELKRLTQLVGGMAKKMEYHRVPKNSDHYSDLSYKEGELKRLAQLVGGMAKKMDSLAREVAQLRRK